jgi:hypothetical protein
MRENECTHCLEIRRPRECEYHEYGSQRLKEHTNWRDKDEGNVSATNTDEEGQRHRLSTHEETNRGVSRVNMNEGS